MTTGHYIYIVKRKIYKEDIVKAGYELMYLNGYNATGIKEITEKIGIPKGSFYNHFTNKEEFGLEVLSYYSKRVLSDMENGMNKGKGSPLKRLKAFYKAAIEHESKTLDCKLGCLIGNFSQEMADVNENFRRRLSFDYEQSCEIIKRCLKECQEKQEIADDWNVDLLSNMIYNSWQGTLTRMKAEKCDMALKDFYQFYFKTLL